MSAKAKIVVILGTVALLVLGLIFFLAYRQFIAFWQSQTKGPTQALGEQPSSFDISKLPSPVSQQDQPVKRVSHAMSEAFDAGFLPSPIPAEEADPDEAAVSLARKIAGRDDFSIPALMSALQLAGLTIRAKNGSILLRPLDSGQGMAFDAWEVASMAKLYDEHWALSLGDFTVVLSKVLPPLSKVSFNDLFLKRIEASAQGEQPLRFWSRLIIELGRNSAQPYDLLTKNVDPSKVQLDAIQVSLILQRIWGDLRARVPATASPMLKSSAYQPIQEPFRLQPAVFHSARTLPLLLHTTDSKGSEAGSAGPCNLSETSLTILDMNAILKTTEWTELIGLGREGAGEEGGLGAGGGVWGGIGEGGPKAGQIVNAVLTLLKALLTYSSLHAEITMDAESLIRTQDLDKGDTIQFATRVWFEMDKWPILNCLRPFLNMGNVDFGNMPNNGAADGVGVSWYLVGGGIDPGVTTQDVPKFLAAQNAATIMFDNGGGHEGETWNNVTNEKGEATTFISGRPQSQDLSHYKLLPRMKKGAVAIEVKLKGSDTKKFLGEMIDVFGPAVGLASGDVVTGLVSGLTELAYRMHWRVGKNFVFPVIDWRMCDKGWLGTITLSRRVHVSASEPWQGVGPGQKTQSVDLTEHREFIIDSSQGSYGNSSLHAEWAGEYERKKIESTTAQGNTQACSKASTEDTTTETLTGDDGGRADFALLISGSRYEITFMPGTLRDSIGGESVHHHLMSLSGLMKGWEPSACNGVETFDSTPIGHQPWLIVAFPLKGALDPKKPEQLTGSQELSDPEDSTSKIIITWDLHHCGS